MKEPQRECPLSSRCELVNDQLIEARVEYVRDLERLQESLEFWKRRATFAIRALEQIGEMVDYQMEGIPLHAGLPEVVREKLGK